MSFERAGLFGSSGLPLGSQPKTGQEHKFFNEWDNRDSNNPGEPSWDGRSATTIPIYPESDTVTTGSLPPLPHLPTREPIVPTHEPDRADSDGSFLQRAFEVHLPPASTFDPGRKMEHLPDLPPGTPPPTQGPRWVPGQVVRSTAQPDTPVHSMDSSMGASAQEGNDVPKQIEAEAGASVPDVLTPVSPAPVTNLLGRPVKIKPPKPSQKENSGTTAPHVVEESSDSGGSVKRFSAAARAGVVASIEGWHRRYARYLLDPTETRPMKKAPYLLLGMHAVARCVETTIPVLSKIDEAITSSEGFWASIGFLGATGWYTFSEARNYPNEPLEPPISARVLDSLKRNLRHPITARRVRQERREELVNIRAGHKSGTYTLASWMQKNPTVDAPTDSE